MSTKSLAIVPDAAPDVSRERQLGPNSIGEALRMLRHRARLTRDALAEGAGVSAGAISNYENDVSAPAAATLRRLARVFSVAQHRFVLARGRFTRRPPQREQPRRASGPRREQRRRR